MIRRAAAAVVLVATLTGLTACSGGGSLAALELPRPTGPTAGPQYVALGDSYAAAPGVPDTSGADGCFRSSGNYATLVATAADLTLTDVTCSGASTETLLEKQVPAITPQAELVTLGVGGNDFDLFSTLIGQCGGPGGSQPGGSPCSQAVTAALDQTLPKIDGNLTKLFDAVAVAVPPGAQVVVVGYPDLLPATGSCPDRVSLAPEDYPLFNRVSQGLSDLLRGQAQRRSFDFVDLEGPSRGHDICSATPWINGQKIAPDGTIPFHPFGVEQQAVARLVTALR